MDTKTLPYRPRRPFLWLLIGAFLGGMITYMYYSKKAPDEPEPIDTSDIGVALSKDQVEALFYSDGLRARFYNALLKDDAASITVVAGSINTEGAHVPDAGGEERFTMFKAVVGSTVDVGRLDRDEAMRHVLYVKETGGQNFSVDLDRDVTSRLFGVDGCMGVGFSIRRTSDGGQTFLLTPVKFEDDRITVVGEAADVIVCAAPCPRICGPVPDHYLHGSTLP